MKELFFSHARIALKFGLELVDLKKGSCILVPDFICEAVLQPLYDLNLIVVFYKTNGHFQTEQKLLEKQIKHNNAVAVMMVHYFGQPQDIKFFLSISKKYNLILIEDNAHGFGGSFENQLLGTFGNIGISSPRKILNCEHGGILYFNGKLIPPPSLLSDATVWNALKSFVKHKLSKRPFLNTLAYRILNRRTVFTNPYSFSEPHITGSKADWYSTYMINKNVLSGAECKVARQRRNKWKEVEKFTTSLGAIPAINDVDENSCPWAFPCYFFDENKKSDFVTKLSKSGYHTFSWPSLPRKDNRIENALITRWNNFLCVSLIGN